MDNTTIGVVATNVRLTKAQATKVAQMAQDGLARTLRPSHSPWDGDTLFALSRGSLRVSQADFVVGNLAAEAVARAILRGVATARSTEFLPGVPPR
jgi:L-aminopeptidase/D-esterase-like protein